MGNDGALSELVTHCAQFAALLALALAIRRIAGLLRGEAERTR